MDISFDRRFLSETQTIIAMDEAEKPVGTIRVIFSDE